MLRPREVCRSSKPRLCYCESVLALYEFAPFFSQIPLAAILLLICSMSIIWDMICGNDLAWRRNTLTISKYEIVLVRGWPEPNWNDRRRHVEPNIGSVKNLIRQHESKKFTSPHGCCWSDPVHMAGISISNVVSKALKSLEAFFT